MKNSGFQRLVSLLDPGKEGKRKTASAELRKSMVELVMKVDMKSGYESWFELFWYSRLPCFDIKGITSQERDDMSVIKRCYWKGLQISCASVFKMTPTDQGMCCSFNLETAEKLYRPGKYLNAIRLMQNQDMNLSFTSKKEKLVKSFMPEPGLTKGLQLVLDAHSDLVSSATISDDFRGFIATVTSPGQFPMTTRNNIVLSSGRISYVGISALSMAANEDIRLVPPEQRKCFFPEELPLKYYNFYSQTNCYLECSLEYTSAMLNGPKFNYTNCVPWFYPATEDVRACDPATERDFQKILGTVPYTECKKCLPDCRQTNYDLRVTSAPFQKCDHTNLGTSALCLLRDNYMNPPVWSEEVRDEFRREMGVIPEYLIKDRIKKPIHSNQRKFAPTEAKQKSTLFKQKITKEPAYDAFENDIALVSFYFDEQEVGELKMSRRMTFSDFVSQAGGLMGLGLGISLISLAEIIYWCSIRLLKNVCNE